MCYSDAPEVGERRSKHNQLITDLILDILKKTSCVMTASLLKEVDCLPFHTSKHVRETMNAFFRGRDSPVFTMAKGFMANTLHTVGFHRQCSVSSPKVAGNTETCGWKRFTCSIDQQEAEGAMYIPKASCLARDDLSKCLNQHPGLGQSPHERQRLLESSQKEIRHLDMLKQFSPLCRHLLQVHCYQMLPFPFYITEQVRLKSHYVTKQVR